MFQSSEAAGEGTTDVRGTDWTVLQEKTEGGVFHELQLIEATVFSLGQRKVTKDHTAAGFDCGHTSQMIKFPSVNPPWGSHPQPCQTP